jgi:hypothetical protein
MTRTAIIFFCIGFSFSKAQINSESKRANWWYFGQGAGIDWSTGSPVVVTNGQTNSYEGTATMSDLNGNLLFYSDGNTIWNKNHVPMQGGLNLLGCDNIPTPIQVSQNAAIVPKPENDSIYYLFSLGCLDFQGYNFNYTIINIKLNGGLGKVISANNFLMRSRTQGIGICRAANGCDTWVVAMDSLGYDCFFKVTASGVTSTPVKNFGGITYFPNGGIYCNYKFSNNLALMANTIYTGYGYDTLMIHQFNNTVGLTYNSIGIPIGNQSVYSVAFSPNNTKLYTTMFSNANGGAYTDTLYQYDISVFDENYIKLSKTVIYADSVCTGHILNGLDGKIYIARGVTSFLHGNMDSLAVINNPNSSGLSCNFNLNGVYLQGKQSTASLPNFDQAYFYPSLNNSCVTNVNEITPGSFKIFPNPVKDFLTIENTQGFDFEIKVVDLNTKVLLKNRLKAHNTNTLDVSLIHSGIYLLQFYNNEKQIIIKFLKE